jgi:histidyl-tRNA synthetase
MRWLAGNPEVQAVKRYQIGKVYPREQADSWGAAKEVYQCDFDIAGVSDSMLPDAELLRVTMEILDGLELGEYVVRINSMDIVLGILEESGIPYESARIIMAEKMASRV